MWFQCVSLLPQDIHGPEDREMLARLAASTEDDQSADSEAAIEKYLRSVLAVENILTLDRLRQVRKDVLRRLRQQLKPPSFLSHKHHLILSKCFCLTVFFRLKFIWSLSSFNSHFSLFMQFRNIFLRVGTKKITK